MTARETYAWGRRFRAHVRASMAGDPAHDLAHVQRVVAWARRLACAEGAALEVVVPAAWLHDVVAVPKDSPSRSQASRLAARAAAAWLLEVEYPERHIEDVAHAIEAHSFSAGVEPRTLEARVVQDADRLDALGAVGVARLYATAGTMGSALVHPDDPVPSEPPGRPLDDRRWATDHFFAKLLTLPASMRTAAGRLEAERRAGFLRTFLDELRRETAVLEGNADERDAGQRDADERD